MVAPTLKKTILWRLSEVAHLRQPWLEVTMNPIHSNPPHVREGGGCISYTGNTTTTAVPPDIRPHQRPKHAMRSCF